jgi:GNAT superfamily N-acetyltransferase
MRAQTGDDGAGELVRDAATVAITGAYTEPAQRSSGVATALLQTVCTWAADQGAARLSVDFETQNIDGARFWLRHFQPVSYSLLRQVDERILWAHADREESAYW